MNNKNVPTYNSFLNEKKTQFKYDGDTELINKKPEETLAPKWKWKPPAPKTVTINDVFIMKASRTDLVRITMSDGGAATVDFGKKYITVKYFYPNGESTSEFIDENEWSDSESVAVSLANKYIAKVYTNKK